MDEFSLIREFFAARASARGDVAIGIGDDGAVVDIPDATQLVLATDMLVEGVHFPVDTDAYSIGYKSLAVNLSDLAAMGAQPAWATLCLSISTARDEWLRAFADGLFDLAAKYDIQLIGGDTSRGPLTATVTAYGFLPRGEALLRSSARPGDIVYVSGELGDAALALAAASGVVSLDAATRTRVQTRLDRPQPRVREGQALRGVANAAIDISDGICADLGHILRASEVGARVEVEKLPVSQDYLDHMKTDAGWDMALTHGDDYELCFTVAPDRIKALHALWQDFDCRLTAIGEIEAQPGLRLMRCDGSCYEPHRTGYVHFSGPTDE